MNSRSTLSKLPATLLGHVEPRLATPPARELTPETSYGFAVIDFARDVLGRPLEPWQEVAVIRGGEMLPDGRPRFRKVLLIVSRQSGKTYLLATLAAFWLYAEQWPLVLGLHSTLAMTRESWQLAQGMVMESPWLAGEIGKITTGNNDPQWVTTGGQRYKIAAATRKGGRGLSVDRLIFDELREQRDWVAYGAAMPSMTARPEAQAWLISNQGDASAVVLNMLRDDAIGGIKGGESDPELGLIEWSAPEDADADDPDAIAASCPRLGRGGRSLESYLAEARQSLRAGGEALATWRTEYLCQPVPRLNPAIDLQAWARAAGAPDGFEDLRGKVALCVDVAMSGQHTTLYAAAVQPDGRARIGAVGEWATPDEARRALPALVARIKPRAFGYLPRGPGATLAADLAEPSRRRAAWPNGLDVEGIRGELTSVAMGFAEQVAAGQIVRVADPLLDEQVIAAEKLPRGDAWVFSRKGGDADALYAAAGAVHLARTLPASLGRIRIVTASDA